MTVQAQASASNMTVKRITRIEHGDAANLSQ